VEIRKSEKQSAADESRRQPLYIHAAQELAEIIANADPGDHLPSEPKLSRRLGVSRATLREAMRLFEERGLIIRRQGVGTVVAETPRVIESGLEILESIETMAARMGVHVEMGTRTFELRDPSEDEQTLFELEPGDKIREIKRAMLTDGRPVAFLVDKLPEGIIPEDVIEDSFGGSVLDLILERGQPSLSHARTEITSIPAPESIATQLRISAGDVLLCFKGSIYDDADRIVNRSESYFLPRAFRFHVVRRFDGVIDAVVKNRKMVEA
jgi:GntR family transcriptional regulator